MPPTAVHQRRNPDEPASRPAIPLRRLFLLTVISSAFAFALQALVAITDAPGAEAIILLAVPIAAGGIIFLGLRPYPVIGRVRLALMVAVALFLVGLALG